MGLVAIHQLDRVAVPRAVGALFGPRPTYSSRLCADRSVGCFAKSSRKVPPEGPHGDRSNTADSASGTPTAAASAKDSGRQASGVKSAGGNSASGSVTGAEQQRQRKQAIGNTATEEVVAAGPSTRAAPAAAAAAAATAAVAAVASEASTSGRAAGAPASPALQVMAPASAAPIAGRHAAEEEEAEQEAEEEVEEEAEEGEEASSPGPDWDPWSDPRVLAELKAQDIPVLEELNLAKHVIINDSFLSAKDAAALRGVFDSRFADPRATHAERFLWDYWHVPDQYTLVRTQAQVYFPHELYGKLEDALLSYGETQLGCRSISPIWMSYYVDGCVQELHCDNPHGPFAFVLSLTPTTDWSQREFVGGETMILQPHVLNYWRNYDPRKGMELQHLVTRVEAPFNRLTVFDPRFPHGVREVRGTRDPRKARLVLHGWFTEPAPFFNGPLDPADAEEALNGGLEPLWEALEAVSGLLTGTLITRVTISGAHGTVTDLSWLADTLVEVPNHDRAAADALLDGQVFPRLRALVQNEVRSNLEALTFPTVPSGEDTVLTFPLVFE